MRLVIQRVKHASVTIEGTVKSKIGQGMLILVGIENADTQEDVEWLVGKTAKMRIFDDENGVMNLALRHKWRSIGSVTVYAVRLMQEGKQAFLVSCRHARHQHPALRGFLPAVEHRNRQGGRHGRVWR